ARAYLVHEQAPPTDASQAEAIPPPTPLLARGSVVGRYMILGRLGQGGMGIVYAAYDPELDRKVALKLLRKAFEPPARAEERLRREAQGMARISHRNVIVVHDVGTFEGRLFVAMECIEGQTLSRWLRQEPRSPAQIVRVFLEAGRGLAAVHA